MVKNKKIRVIICFCLLLLVGIFIVLGVDLKIKHDKEKIKKINRQRKQKIEKVLNNIDDIYCDYDFDEIEKLYNDLDDLKYDTSKMRKIFEYDKSVYNTVFNYNTTLKKVDEEVYSTGSLRQLLNTLSTSTKEFEALDINEESMLGTYISDVRNNLMYSMFNNEFVLSDDLNVDEAFTSYGYRNIVKFYTENILEVEIPTWKISEGRVENETETRNNYDNRIGNRNKPLKVGEQITIEFMNYQLYSQMNITLKLDSVVDKIATFSITLNKSVNEAPLKILSEDDYGWDDHFSLLFGKTNNPKEYQMKSFGTDDVVWIMDTVSIGMGETKQISYDVNSIDYMVLVTELSDIDNPNLEDYDKYTKGSKSGTYDYYTFFDVSGNN